MAYSGDRSGDGRGDGREVGRDVGLVSACLPNSG